MMSIIKKSFSQFVSVLTAVLMLCAMTAFPQSESYAVTGLESEAELKSKENQLAMLINEYRISNGLNAVYVVPYLNEVSDVRVNESVELFSHYRPNGTKFSTAIDQSVFPFCKVYETLAAGSDTAEATFGQWLNSPDHNKILLTENITHMGVGVVHDTDTDYHWYWQTVYAVTDAQFADQYLPTEYEIVPQAEGDITGDGFVDTYDYLSLADYLYKKANNIPVYLNPAQLQTADCFRDGILSEADAKVMVRYILGEYKTLPYIF